MTTETQTTTPLTVQLKPVGCDFAVYLDQGVGTAGEVAEMARDAATLLTSDKIDVSLTAQTTADLAVTVSRLSYPGTKQDKLITDLTANTKKTIGGALAGAYIAQNCVDCPAAEDCNLLQALRAQYDEGLAAKGKNETMAFAITARRLAESIKPKFTSVFNTQERVRSGWEPEHKLSDIMRVNDSARGGISRLLMDPANKPYRNEAVATLRTLLRQDSKGGALAKRAEESNAFSVFDGIAVEAFVGEAVATSGLVGEVQQATRAQDVTEGTDFFLKFTDKSGKDRSVRIDAKSSRNFRKLKDQGKIKGLKVGNDSGHFGVKTVRIEDATGRKHKEQVLVICPTGDYGDADSGFDATPLPETGCVDLQQAPNEEFTQLINDALITFVKHYQ